MAAPTKISEPHWTLILERLEKRACVPFLGAGVNATVEGTYEGLPSGSGLALRLVEDLTGTVSGR